MVLLVRIEPDSLRVITTITPRRYVIVTECSAQTLTNCDAITGDDNELAESVGRAGLQYTSSKASEKKNFVSNV